MNNWIYLLLLLALGYFVLINLLVVLSVRKMSHPEALIKPREGEGLPPDERFRQWIHQRGFQRESQFDFYGTLGSDQPLEVNAWLSPERDILVLLYCFGDKQWLDIISSFNDQYVLVSSDTPDALFLPQPPNIMLQVFVDMAPDALYQKHLEARDYLIQRFGVSPDKVDVPVTRLVADAIRHQMDYIRSLPLWYLRGAWWKLFRGRRYRNKSVIELIESLPNGR